MVDAATYNRNLPKFLHRTDELLREEQERQDALRPKQITYDEDAVLYNRALVDEQTALETLQAATDEEVISFNRLKLAESYLEQGKFYQAWRTHPDTRYREWLKKINDAPETKPCGHAATKNFVENRTIDGKEIRNVAQIPNFRLWRIVYDGSPHKYINIYLCNICREVWKERQ